MKSDKPTSAGNSAGTSSSAAPRNQSEAEYLARQADDAKRAMATVLEELKSDLRHGVDVRRWAKAYPLATLGTAAAAGLVAGLVLTPRRKKTAEGQTVAIEPEPAPAPRERKKGEKSTWWTLLGHVYDMAKPAIASAIAANLTARATEPAGDGQAQEAERVE